MNERPTPRCDAAFEACPGQQNAARCPVLVLGVGNLLRGDEGIGIHVVETMASMELPAGVEVLDGGTAGLDLVDDISGRELVVIVDAIQSDQPSGSIVRLRGSQSLLDHAGMSMHDAGVASALAACKFTGDVPTKVVMIGIVPESLGWTTCLSPRLQSGLQHIVDIVLGELTRHLGQRIEATHGGVS